MSFSTKNALELLIKELESLLTDIRTIEDVQNSKEKNNEITPYVYLENTNLLKKEISSIQWVIKQLSHEHFIGAENAEQFSEILESFLEENHINANMPGAAIYLVRNKIEKVLYQLAEG
ncbi:MAG: hypothetical protein JW874_05250 [Spirochaetales bacterium]|nr:hypothetical protein [Spirochaetales bacterium]